MADNAACAFILFRRCRPHGKAENHRPRGGPGLHPGVLRRAGIHRPCGHLCGSQDHRSLAGGPPASRQSRRAGVPEHRRRVDESPRRKQPPAPGDRSPAGQRGRCPLWKPLPKGSALGNPAKGRLALSKPILRYRCRVGFLLGSRREYSRAATRGKLLFCRKLGGMARISTLQTYDR